MQYFQKRNFPVNCQIVSIFRSIVTRPTRAQKQKQMTYENLLWEEKGSILKLTINREKKLNALNLKTVEELAHAIRVAQEKPEIKGIILTGAGSKAFVAGADISEIANLNAEQGQMFAENGQAAFAEIEACRKPVIAAVNGFALGGGCELAMACHMRVASENARFGQPEVNLGIIPGYGGTQRLSRYIGHAKAMELMLTGDMLTAPEALSLKLLNYVVTPAELFEKCEEILNKIFMKGPIAVGQVIRSVNAHYTKPQAYQVEAEAFGKTCATEDFKEGTKAFLEKRKPNFQGK